MASEIPEKLIYFLKNAEKDVDDGYEYGSELNRILNSDDCQLKLSGKEIEQLRDYADKVKKIGEINYYTLEKIKEIEREMFGGKGILGYLGNANSIVSKPDKPVWPF